LHQPQKEEEDNVILKLKPSQLIALLVKAIPAKLPVFIVSEPGVGKTTIIKYVVEELLGWDLVISHPPVEDPTDSKGIPWGDGKGNIDFRPVGQVKRVLAAKKPTYWFLDDFGQAPPAVQAPYMQWFHGGECAGHKLPDCVVMGAASNARTHRAGVSGILEPVKSRFNTIVELTADLEEWCAWGLTHGVPAEVVAFLRFQSELLCKFEPSADLTNSPLPRTWEHLGQLFNLNLPEDVQPAAYAGSVGVEASTKFLGFLRMIRDVPNIDAIFADPDKALIPERPEALYAVTVGLAARADVKNFQAIARYAERLMEASRGEFATFLMRDALRRDPSLASGSPYVAKLLAGELGRLIGGKRKSA
jgi:hypothetical protein